MIGLGPKLARSGRHLKETKDMTFFLRRIRIRTISILVENIIDILFEDIFRHLILERIRIKDSLRRLKDKDNDFWAIWEVYAG